MKLYSVQEINTILKGELVGDTTQKIDGLEQLKKVDKFIEKRCHIHIMYDEALKDLYW